MMDLIMDLCGMSCISWLFRLAEGGGFLPVLISCQLRELIHLASWQDSDVYVWIFAFMDLCSCEFVHDTSDL